MLGVAVAAQHETFIDRGRQGGEARRGWAGPTDYQRGKEGRTPI